MRAPAISAACGGEVAMITPGGSLAATSIALRVATRAQKYSLPTGASSRQQIAFTSLRQMPLPGSGGSKGLATRCTVPCSGSEGSSRPCAESRISCVITCTSKPWRTNSRVRKLKRFAPTSGLGAK
jgi:hypothetical protein